MNEHKEPRLHPQICFVACNLSEKPANPPLGFLLLFFFFFGINTFYFEPFPLLFHANKTFLKQS